MEDASGYMYKKMPMCQLRDHRDFERLLAPLKSHDTAIVEFVAELGAQWQHPGSYMCF
jgi:hypothetical protein